MLFRSLALIAASLAASASATFTLSYDTVYDNPNNNLTTVACSDGPNGLIPKGFFAFSSLPTFPHIGGAEAIAGWNDPNCGSCWNITYNGTSITLLAIDHAVGFNVAQKAMDDLTNNQAVWLGRINVDATQVPASNCGLH